METTSTTLFHVPEWVLLAGRILFALSIFMLGNSNLFAPKSQIAYAQSKNVPFASITVPLSGLLVVLGTLSIALGWYARAGALLLVIFLIPTSFMMHDFWSIEDVQQKMNQRIHFWKNMALLGGALIIMYFGSGPYSIH